MLALIAASLVLCAGRTESPDVWLASSGGKLARAGREGNVVQAFEVPPTRGSIVYRARQIAFSDGANLAWLTGAGAFLRAKVAGKIIVGWRDTEALTWDGTFLATIAGVKLAMQPRSGDTPVFAALSGSSGTLVSRTATGTLRITVNGAQPLAVDFGKWKLGGAQMETATSGYLLLVGSGSAVVRVAKGRADIVAIDRDGNLGVGIASDGRAYIARHAISSGGAQPPSTDVEEVRPTGVPVAVCRIAGRCDIIDLDRKSHALFVVRTGENGPFYERVNYLTGKATVLEKQVDFVAPAFGSIGFVAPGATAASVATSDHA